MPAPDAHSQLSDAARLEDPGSGLAAVGDLRRHLDHLQLVHVENALRAGWSWSQVADALGVTRQAAHRRYARVVKERLEEVRDSANASGSLVVSGSARLAVHLARQEAEALRHAMVGTEHLLLGLLRLGCGPGSKALHGAGVSLAHARAAVADLHAEGEQPDDPPRFARPTAPLPPSPQCRAALERAVHEAAQRGEDRLRPEHLLAALLSDPASGAARTLARLGIASGALAA